jgi:uncharacterized lipoprotein YajG
MKGNHMRLFLAGLMAVSLLAGCTATVSQQTNASAPRPVVETVYDGFAKGDIALATSTMSPDIMWLEADFVVRECLEAVEKEQVPTMIVPGRQYRTLLWLNRHMPWLANMLMSRNSSKYRTTD